MSSIFHSHHPVRIFFVTGLLTLAALAFIGLEAGIQPLFIAIALILVEITFSFDNAIINAKVLATMSRAWQTAFMTIGILIAVFGMRLVFPILIVMLTADLSASSVIDLALNHPETYSEKLDASHHTIYAFGGMFLLMLSLHFFFDQEKSIHWVQALEKRLKKFGTWWMHIALSFIVLIIAALCAGEAKATIFFAGIAGIITYAAVHGLAELFTKKSDTGKAAIKTGMAGFMSFLYLEILDASFSFDGVIGAFAITQDVVLIAAGLGIGALWVRSLTLFMVRRRTLNAYVYLEHGAHYTILMLSLILLLGIFIHIPEAIAGTLALLIIGASIVSSVRARKTTSINDKTALR